MICLPDAVRGKLRSSSRRSCAFLSSPVILSHLCSFPFDLLYSLLGSLVFRVLARAGICGMDFLRVVYILVSACPKKTRLSGTPCHPDNTIFCMYKTRTLCISPCAIRSSLACHLVRHHFCIALTVRPECLVACADGSALQPLVILHLPMVPVLQDFNTERLGPKPAPPDAVENVFRVAVQSLPVLFAGPVPPAKVNFWLL